MQYLKLFSFALLVFITTGSTAQLPDWQHKDLSKDSIFGVSSDRAYSELLKGRKSKRILVAVIYSGVDTAHEDLAPVIWGNPKEKSNGKDDDRNGYADDRHGWDFIGGKSGDVAYDNLELVRVVRRDKPFFDSLEKAGVPAAYQKSFDEWTERYKTYQSKFTQAQNNYKAVGGFKEVLERIMQSLPADSLAAAGFKNYTPKDEAEKHVRKVILQNLETGTEFTSFKTQQVDKAYDYYREQAEYQLNIDFDPRPLVGDNYNNSGERFYGNNNVYGPKADHGTHVTSIIAATRNNTTGMSGIADNVRIICVRAVPNGDERDKDIANAIRYATDNGATVINMSFGKAYSWDKKAVDEAVRYAASRDVLLVHAAGNEGVDLDLPASSNFPNKYFGDGSGSASNWIEVGASGAKDDSTLVAVFSNYGKQRVDVFAPGVQIYSTTPQSLYEYFDGTSMAAPVVAGIAAVIRSYYPRLSAVQVREIILLSAIRRDILKDKCATSGVANLYTALQLAAHYKPRR